MGLCITVTCIVELPIFAANNWILKKLGVNSVIHITLAVCVIRMVSSKHAHPAIARQNSSLCMEAVVYHSSICLVIASALQQSLTTDLAKHLHVAVMHFPSWPYQPFLGSPVWYLASHSIDAKRRSLSFSVYQALCSVVCRLLTPPCTCGIHCGGCWLWSPSMASPLLASGQRAPSTAQR